MQHIKRTKTGVTVHGPKKSQLKRFSYKELMQTLSQDGHNYSEAVYTLYSIGWSTPQHCKELAMIITELQPELPWDWHRQLEIIYEQKLKEYLRVEFHRRYQNVEMANWVEKKEKYILEGVRKVNIAQKVKDGLSDCGLSKYYYKG